MRSPQHYFAPKTVESWKWGIGPQVTLKTRSNDRLAGFCRGGGLTGVVFGASGQWSFGALAMQIWDEDEFSIATLSRSCFTL